MDNVYERTRWLIGSEALERLQNSRVVVFGAGGVGGYVIEALARAGVGAVKDVMENGNAGEAKRRGELTIVDFDKVDITNINRQIIALHSTVGRLKVDVMGERIADINPDINTVCRAEKIDEETIGNYDFSTYDYVVDAVDDVKAKLLIIEEAKKAGTAVISSMGTGNKMDPSRFIVTDISKTHTCPLARRVRKELSMKCITGVKVLFSDELPARAEIGSRSGKISPASISFVPSAAGLRIASEVIKDLLDPRFCGG